MTVREMMYEFQRLIETIYPAFETNEKINSETIIRFLNWGYDRYFKNKYLAGRSNKETLLILQKNSADITTLLKKSGELPLTQSPTYSTVYNVDIPADYIFFMRGDVKLERTFFPDTGGTTTWVPMMMIDYDEIDPLLPTPTNFPLIDKPAIYTDDSNTLSVVVDDYTTPYVINITYLRKPKELSLDIDDQNKTTVCELSSGLHEEIVKLAVEMYITEYKFKLSQKEGK